MHLDAQQAASILGSLKYAKDMHDYLAPQFEAFNAARLNVDVKTDLESTLN